MSDEPVVYQLRVVSPNSPLIWRRLLVRSDITLANLYATLRTALGWSDEHLNRFVIHGREYGVADIGGAGFADDPRQVRLGDSGLRVAELFRDDYDFSDGWHHDVAQAGQFQQTRQVGGGTCQARYLQANDRPHSPGQTRLTTSRNPLGIFSFRRSRNFLAPCGTVSSRCVVVHEGRRTRADPHLSRVPDVTPVTPAT